MHAHVLKRHFSAFVSQTAKNLQTIKKFTTGLKITTETISEIVNKKNQGDPILKSAGKCSRISEMELEFSKFRLTRILTDLKNLEKCKQYQSCMVLIMMMI